MLDATSLAAATHGHSQTPLLGPSKLRSEAVGSRYPSYEFTLMGPPEGYAIHPVRSRQPVSTFASFERA
ncbi:hypothetical protein CGRA01v4_13888 [Colletotrichum graminicola]|uniref:Uncharacterized protein n=1 Tax=Colletotrichum graminicola (strain M1.001 / M2 / FGSC 10212) TaxID=645133 RepID=E3QUI1_COLGM|nr:uncharacterized protein GLRG_09663 [Colletotrichum graminicola M1.001]EFQ34519.1 hypothetical protein GLRG_09663 [Colletotrichum graminicola M1.001]WDK22598.1 hypothetical protein CGRA01v4_13888 [Colletotrichum graminicola]